MRQEAKFSTHGIFGETGNILMRGIFGKQPAGFLRESWII